ncbi:YigZ family protein [Methanolobus mangrovi]|uniref:YigZ family protein n=1 Tax=Methanolobus mangrovi TaxID=3072977 RepID=A0AA51YIX7_9EURY|nr:YigZ family protein [Methanolobus mangrovi]WMW22025.1 YigZ family protein [Methanolobus mangrovi]
MSTCITLKETGQAQKKFRNSIFIACAVPVTDEDDAKKFIKLIKSKHTDANHNVSAYLINADNVLAMKYDDDGEPAGSSGKPVFRVLEMKELSNVAVVVSRYFGGIKLGFGGLARAYRETAIEAIENAGTVEVRDRTLVHMESDYSNIDAVTKLVSEYGTILEAKYTDVVHFTVEVDSESKDALIEKVINVTKNRVIIK